MRLRTASETIRFAEELEGASARLYEDLSRQFTQHRDLFMALAKENKRNIQDIKRAYYGVITDAIEGGFAFDIDTDGRQIPQGAADTDIRQAMETAIRAENVVSRFYLDAAEQSKALMGDLSRSFVQVAKRRQNRVAQLKSAFVA